MEALRKIAAGREVEPSSARTRLNLPPKRAAAAGAHLLVRLEADGGQAEQHLRCAVVPLRGARGARKALKGLRVSPIEKIIY